MRSHLSTLSACALSLVLSGCLGTVVRSPAPGSREISTTHVHVLAAPFRVEATACPQAMAMVATYVPPWGVAVGILTFGILVPKTTLYTCVKGDS